MKKHSVSEENYLKAVYHLEAAGERVLTNDLARTLSAKPASITDMVQKLTEKGLLDYQKYQGVQLTPEGRKQALSVIRKHRLWESFLVEKLGFNWDEVHEIAEELEHISSKKLVEKLDAFLNFPKLDPHGDPIPDKNGKIVYDQALVPLIELPANQPAIVMSVASQSADFLELLRFNNIVLGVKLEVKKRFDFDQSLQIKIPSRAAFTVSAQMAQSIKVKPVEI